MDTLIWVGVNVNCFPKKLFCKFCLYFDGIVEYSSDKKNERLCDNGNKENTVR